MIKPEAMRGGHWPQILDLLLRNRFQVRRLELRRLSQDLAQRFYAEHEGKPFFEALVEYITGGEVLAVWLEGDDAVARLRALVGATNPAQATPGTLRYMFGTSLQENAVHASDSDVSAGRELGLIFAG
jgi:nucleoside-diphosphate kinase